MLWRTSNDAKEFCTANALAFGIHVKSFAANKRGATDLKLAGMSMRPNGPER